MPQHTCASPPLSEQALLTFDELKRVVVVDETSVDRAVKLAADAAKKAAAAAKKAARGGPPTPADE